MRRTIVALVFGAVSFAVYVGNGETISSSDAVPGTLFAYTLATHATLYDDAFRGTYLDSGAARYAFSETPDGHLASLFPIGTGLLALPLFAALEGVRVATTSRHRLPPLGPAFEDERRFDEKIVAAAIAACAVGLCYLTLRRFATPFAAVIATYVFAFAGELWTIGSQGLWQHGPVNLVLLAATYATLRACSPGAERPRIWRLCAGLCAGFLVTIRPTALFFTLALVVFIAMDASRRSALRSYALGVIAGVLPGILWNALVFYSIDGGYAANVALYHVGVAQVGTALAGLWLSPSRGWLVFSPIVVFSIAGFIRAGTSAKAEARLVALFGCAALALVANYAFFRGWAGGHCYGPRFYTDLSAAGALALAFVLPPSLSTWRTWSREDRARTAALSALFVVLLVVSTTVQIVGSYSGAAGPIWNAVPIDIGIDKQRIWSDRDTQIERNARAMYYRYAPSPTSGTNYAVDFAGSVLGVTWRTSTLANADRVVPNAISVASALIRNDGTSPWYGYDTAVYNGEARIAATLSDARGTIVSRGTFYVSGVVPAGATGTAVGTLRVPAHSGRYVLDLRPFSFLRPDVPARNLHSFTLSVFVR